MLPNRSPRSISLPQWLARLSEYAGTDHVLDNLAPLTEHYLNGYSVKDAADWLALRVGAAAILEEWFSELKAR